MNPPRCASRWTSATRLIILTGDPRKFGETNSAAARSSRRGPNINPKVFTRLLAVAKKAKIPHQTEADPRPTGTDAMRIQTARGGVACGLVSILPIHAHAERSRGFAGRGELRETFVEFAKSTLRRIVQLVS